MIVLASIVLFAFLLAGVWALIGTGSSVVASTSVGH
jgi:hypothetical protein